MIKSLGILLDNQSFVGFPKVSWGLPVGTVDGVW